MLYLRYTHCKGSAECFNEKNNVAFAHNSYRTDMEFLATFRSCSGLFGAEIEEVVEAIRWSVFWKLWLRWLLKCFDPSSHLWVFEAAFYAMIEVGPTSPKSEICLDLVAQTKFCDLEFLPMFVYRSSFCFVLFLMWIAGLWGHVLSPPPSLRQSTSLLLWSANQTTDVASVLLTLFGPDFYLFWTSFGRTHRHTQMHLEDSLNNIFIHWTGRQWSCVW